MMAPGDRSMKREESAIESVGTRRTQDRPVQPGRTIKPAGGGCIALHILAAMLAASTAHAGPRQSPAPMILSESEMDRVTAGGLGLRVDLASAARGPAAFAAVAGETRIGRATVLDVVLDPAAPPAARARLTGTEAVEIGLGSGRASAAGDDAHCTASIAAVGDIAFLHSLSSAAATPSSAPCLCSVFAIAPIK